MDKLPSTLLPAGSPVRRRYPSTPLVGVAAAVFNAMGQILLVQRGRPPLAGQWGIPGGLLEVGEKLRDGAMRELDEECGIEIAIGGIAGVFEPITLDAAGAVEYHYVVVDFWASHVGGDVIAGDDAAAAVWINLDQLNSYAMPTETRQLVVTAHGLWQDAHKG